MSRIWLRGTADCPESDLSGRALELALTEIERSLR